MMVSRALLQRLLFLLLGGVLPLWPLPLAARTATLTLETEGTGAAVIAAATPDLSWSPTAVRGSRLYAEDGNTVSATAGILLRFDLSKIPRDHQIVRAELLLPYLSGTPNSRLYLWRVLQPWGTGVNHRARMLRPKVENWAGEGGRSRGKDRASDPSATAIPPQSMGEIPLNVIGDVELWYGGSAVNHGWLLTMENPGDHARFARILTHARQWRLRITYEPL